LILGFSCRKFIIDLQQALSILIFKKRGGFCRRKLGSVKEPDFLAIKKTIAFVFDLEVPSED
jgi:hypothetical protein